MHRYLKTNTRYETSTLDLSPSQNEQSGKSRSDDEGLEVLTPRPAAHVKPAHLGADLSPLLTFEVKRALENGLNGSSSSNHKRAVHLDFFSIQHQLSL